MAGFFSVLMLIASFLFFSRLLYLRQHKLRHVQLDRLKDMDFEVHHLLDAASHYVAFDSTRHRIAFATNSDVQTFNFSDIADIQWVWVERNGKKETNFLNFRLNNVGSPLFKVRCLSAHQAEHWNAKLPAICS